MADACVTLNVDELWLKKDKVITISLYLQAKSLHMIQHPAATQQVCVGAGCHWAENTPARDGGISP